MVEHLNNAIHWYAIHAWWRKTSTLDMAPQWPKAMADVVIHKCARNRYLNALFPFLVSFGAHILSFYEWKVVYQRLGDNSDVTSVYTGKSARDIYVKKYNFRVLVLQGSAQASIRRGGKI